MLPFLDTHLEYVTDACRVTQFSSALRALVSPDTIVLDLGCGSGILGVLACRAGAKRVYAVDHSAFIEGARTTAKANGCGDRIVHIRGNSLDIVLPEKASLIVSDQLSPLGPDYGVIRFSLDANLRHLEIGGHLCPRAITTVLMPVEHPCHRTQVAGWDRAAQGVELGHFRSLAANTVHDAGADAGTPLCAERPIWSVDLAGLRTLPASLEGHVEWTAVRSGELNGLLGWFVADLGGEIVLTNNPLHSSRANRPCAFLPVDPPVPVRAGDQIEVTLRSVPETGPTTWRVRVSHGGTFTNRVHSTLKGRPISIEDLKARRQGIRPIASDRARARAYLLNHCDGTRDIAGLTSGLVTHFPKLWESHDAAERFVWRVLREAGAETPY